MAMLSPSAATAQSEGVPWRTDYQAACAEAQQSGKLVLAHFWTETCGPCKELDARVFSQPQVAMGLSAHYIPVKINANESPELAKSFGVTRIPADAVVTPDGKLVKAFMSPTTPMEYVGFANRLATAYHAQGGQAYAVAARSAPAPSTPAPDFDQSFAERMEGATTPAVGSRYGDLATNSAQPSAPQPTAQSNRYVDVPQQAPAAPAVTPTESAPRQPAPSAVAEAPVQLPPGSPPLGFDGFCPVTMKKEWRWAKGDVRYGAIHRGRTYLFTSAEAQKTFLATPDAFSPVLAGSDPVAAVDDRRSVPGVREYAVEYEGRFYLFANEQTLEKFWSDPTGYATGVERVAALPAGDSFIR